MSVFNGLRVLDVASFIAGPAAATILADFGADVIKIEPPDGDPHRNSYRNPVIAEAMKAMDYVNRYGYGIQRAQDLLAANGNPPAEFEIDDRVFLVTLRRRPA